VQNDDAAVVMKPSQVQSAGVIEGEMSAGIHGRFKQRGEAPGIP
jgi:hypothetical protein